MSLSNPAEPEVLAAITSLMAAPLALLVVLLWMVRRRRLASSAEIERALDEVLRRDSEALLARRGRDLIAFRPAESFRLKAHGRSRVEVVRTIRSALVDGYRVRVRAMGRHGDGRTIIRHVDLDLRNG